MNYQWKICIAAFFCLSIGAFFTKVFSVFSDNLLLCAGGNIVTLSSRYSFEEQVIQPNTVYKIRHNFSLRQSVVCDLRLNVFVEGDSYFRAEEPLNLLANQTVWIPSDCILLDSSFKKLTVSDGTYSPVEPMAVFLAGKEKKTGIKLDVAGCVTIPDGCTLQFASGSLCDGIVCGSKTVLKYKKPFLSNIYLLGDWVSSTDVCDEDVFIDKNYTWSRVQSCFRITSPSNNVSFSKHIYKNMRTIDLERDISVDFGGSSFYMALDRTGLPYSFLMTEPSSDRSQESNRLSCVSIRNATIVGNPAYTYNGTAVPGFSGKYRRAIQLFKISNVSIENVQLSNYVVGTNNSPNGLPPVGINRFINSAIVIWGYDQCLLNGIDIHDCHADNLIRLVPNINDENKAVIKNCHSYKNFTGLLTIFDGRVECYKNVVEDYNSSAFNLFCYNSSIHHNTFLNSTRSVAIDLSEDGTYQSQRVDVYNNNVQSSVGGLVDICGNNIVIKNNTINGSGEGETAMYLSVPRVTGFEIGEKKK